MEILTFVHFKSHKENLALLIWVQGIYNWYTPAVDPAPLQYFLLGELPTKHWARHGIWDLRQALHWKKTTTFQPSPGLEFPLGIPSPEAVCRAEPHWCIAKAYTPTKLWFHSCLHCVSPYSAAPHLQSPSGNVYPVLLSLRITRISRGGGRVSPLSMAGLPPGTGCRKRQPLPHQHCSPEKLIHWTSEEQGQRTAR